jgi:hypothetical protein
MDHHQIQRNLHNFPVIRRTLARFQSAFDRQIAPNPAKTCPQLGRRIAASGVSGKILNYTIDLVCILAA